MSCLHIAVKSENFELVNLLLYRNADPNIMDQYNCSPLHYAIFKGMYDITQLLVIKYNCNIYNNDIYGNSPYDVATHHKHPLLVSILENKNKKN